MFKPIRPHQPYGGDNYKIMNDEGKISREDLYTLSFNTRTKVIKETNW